MISNSTSMIIPAVDVAELVAEILFKSNDLPKVEEEIFKSLTFSCEPIYIEGGEIGFRVDDVKALVKNFVQAVRGNDSSCLRQMRGICVERIVGVQEFVESREFMVQRDFCRPAVMEGLIELFDSTRSEAYIECVLTGSVGWGKTYFGYLAVAYMLYKLSCFYNPQIEYDNAPGTSIVFIQQSKKLELARKVVFEQFAEMIKRSPYFMTIFPFDPKVRSELRFPKNIFVLPVGGQDTAAIGMNVYGGVIDEMNFMARIRESERFLGGGVKKGSYDQAERVYTTLIRRMKTRFMQKGRLPGKLLLVSSVNYPGDFTDRKTKEAVKDKTILALKHTQWEVLPKDRFSGEVFYVEIGNDRKLSRIVPTREMASDEEDVIEVPVEYKGDFERDLISALKDYAGVTTGSSHPFIPYKELIVACSSRYMQITGGKTLFRLQDVVIDDVVDPVNPEWENLVDESYIEECIVDPTVPFCVHIDAAASECAAGLGIGRIHGYKLLPSAKYYDVRARSFVEVKDRRAPVYMIDGVIGFLPPADGRQIDFELMRDLVVWLKSKLNLKWVTMDSYQSTMMIQSFRKAGMRSGVLSVDTSIDPYTEVKLSIKDERLLLPSHLILEKELREIEKDPGKDRVNHLELGSKDRSDAVAGVVYMLQRKEANYGGGRRKSRTEAPEPVQEQRESDLPIQTTRHVKVAQGIERAKVRRRMRW